MNELSMRDYIPFFQALIWPVTIFFILFILRKDLRLLLKHFSTAEDFNLSLGPLTFQAKAMREILRSLDVEFPEQRIDKADIEALINSKIRGIQGALEYKTTQADVRDGSRTEVNEKIKITRKDGSTAQGFARNVSPDGIGFRSSVRLRRNETVSISPAEQQISVPVSLPNPVMIVRAEPMGAEFYYGAKISTSSN
jgi:hypothetical protein